MKTIEFEAQRPFQINFSLALPRKIKEKHVLTWCEALSGNKIKELPPEGHEKMAFLRTFILLAAQKMMFFYC